MTLLAGEVAVRAEELELAHGVVIEAHILRPPLGVVAFITGLLELTLVEIVVAVGAGRIDGTEVPLLVTGRALQPLVLSLELEPAQAVVEEADRPLLESTVTPIAADIAELGSMQVEMAEGAVGGRVVLGLGAVRVAPKAGLVAVLSLEGKSRNAVVEAGLLPADGGVTIAARAVAEGGPVGVFLFVTTPTFAFGRTIFTARVTFLAGHLLVLPLERELAHRVVIEAQVSAPKARFTVTFSAGHPFELFVVR